MASSLFPQNNKPSSSGMGSVLDRVSAIKSMISGKNPNDVLNTMLQTNPQFAQFYDANKNKPIEQIASENGVNLDTLKSLFK